MKGICFIEPLFNKVILGEKTQTRRILNIQPKDDRAWRVGTFLESTARSDDKYRGKNHYLLLGGEYSIKEVDSRYFSPKYKLNEIVYLKEPYFIDCSGDIHHKFGYPENIAEMERHNTKWSNKRFMPESAARYYIIIKGVRAERLQDISEEDCLKEGITKHQIIRLDRIWYENGLTINGCSGWPTPQEAYAALIDKIDGNGIYKSNPFFWVYDFKLLEN